MTMSRERSLRVHKFTNMYICILYLQRYIYIYIILCVCVCVFCVCASACLCVGSCILRVGYVTV